MARLLRVFDDAQSYVIASDPLTKKPFKDVMAAVEVMKAAQEVLVGNKGPTFLDVGYVWAPYVPLSVNPCAEMPLPSATMPCSALVPYFFLPKVLHVGGVSTALEGYGYHSCTKEAGHPGPHVAKSVAQQGLLAVWGNVEESQHVWIDAGGLLDPMRYTLHGSFTAFPKGVATPSEVSALTARPNWRNMLSALFWALRTGVPSLGLIGIATTDGTVGTYIEAGEGYVSHWQTGLEPKPEMFYVSLHTAKPGDDQTSHEVSFKGYARQPLTDEGVKFPECKGVPTAGKTVVVTHFAIGNVASGPGPVLYTGQVSVDGWLPHAVVTKGVTVNLAISMDDVKKGLLADLHTSSKVQSPQLKLGVGVAPEVTMTPNIFED